MKALFRHKCIRQCRTMLYPMCVCSQEDRCRQLNNYEQNSGSPEGTQVSTTTAGKFIADKYDSRNAPPGKHDKDQRETQPCLLVSAIRVVDRKANQDKKSGPAHSCKDTANLHSGWRVFSSHFR